MAESSDGPQTDRWKCVNPNCKLELPKNLPAMRFCPGCGTLLTQKIQCCVRCSAPLMSPTDAMNHSCEASRKPTPPVFQQRNDDLREPDRTPETSQPPPKPPSAGADDSALQSAFSDANRIVAASTTSQTGSSDPSHAFLTSSESVASSKPQGPTSSPLPEEDFQPPKPPEIATIGRNGSSNSRTALVTGKDRGVSMESHKGNSSSADSLSNVDHSQVSDTTQAKTISGEKKKEKENQERDVKNRQSIKMEQKENGTTFVDPLRSAPSGSSCSDSSKGETSVSTKFQVVHIVYKIFFEYNNTGNTPIKL